MHSREQNGPSGLFLWPLWGLFGWGTELCWELFVFIETFYSFIIPSPFSLFLLLMMSYWKLSAVVAEGNGSLSQMSDVQPANTVFRSLESLMPLLLSHIAKRHREYRTRDDPPQRALANFLHLCEQNVQLARKFC